jgi:outer membrane lipase/esterase
MHGFKTTLSALAMAIALVGCGGGSDDRRYDTLVSFGDSLSDVGSYRTPGIAALGGGKYTVNGMADGVWVEQLATRLSVPTLCAAQTGLQASGLFVDLAGPVANHAECTAYGQGGSRVTDPIGPWNAAMLALPTADAQFMGQLGQLTSPVADQVARHLAAHGGSFSGKELVTVLAGANDVFVQADAVVVAVQAAATQAATAAAQSGATPEQIAAAGQAAAVGALQTAAPAAIAALAQAGAELAALVKSQIVGKGATHVVVVNLPNISNTPASARAESNVPGSKQLADQMTLTFNGALANGLAGTSATVLPVDLYTANTDQAANPAKYGLANVTSPACNNSFPNAPGFLAPSLICNTGTLVAGDSSRFLFADEVHPTPYGHGLLRDLALDAMKAAGWI